MTRSDVIELRERLEQAIQTGEVIGIIYHGGSQPGAYRQIAPLGVDDEKVRARCYMSHAVKTFALDRIELRDAAVPTPSDIASTWSADATPPVQRFETVPEIVAHYRGQLESEGWHVEHEVGEEGEYLSLYARSKNGALRKQPAVSLGYEAIGYDLVVTPDGGFEKANPRPRSRPWSVRGKGCKSSGTWAHVEGALRCFLEAAAQRPS